MSFSELYVFHSVAMHDLSIMWKVQQCISFRRKLKSSPSVNRAISAHCDITQGRVSITACTKKVELVSEDAGKENITFISIHLRTCDCSLVQNCEPLSVALLSLHWLLWHRSFPGERLPLPVLFALATPVIAPPSAAN